MLAYFDSMVCFMSHDTAGDDEGKSKNDRDRFPLKTLAKRMAKGADELKAKLKGKEPAFLLDDCLNPE